MALAGKTVFDPGPVQPESSPFTSRVGRAHVRSSVVKPVSPASLGMPKSFLYFLSLKGSEADAAQLLRAEKRETETEDGLDGDGERHELHRHPEGVPKLRVAPEVGVVVEADVAERPSEAIEVRAGAEPVPEGIDEDDDDDEHRRRQKQVGQGPVEPCPLQPGARRSSYPHQP